MELYSAILITYANGDTSAYVTTTDYARQDGLYHGGSNEKRSWACHSFKTCQEACDCANDFIGGQK